MFGGSEEWSTGFFMGEENADADVPTQLMADEIRNKWSDYFQSAGADISNQYIFTQCKVARFQTDGHTELDSVVYSHPAATVDGDEATIKLPSQCTLVVTLTSDRVRGKASKGRMFLPGIATMPDATGRLTTTQCNTNIAQLKVFFDAINAHADIPNKVILAAKWSGVLGINPAQNDYVTGLKLGTVIDTQRRRRNDLAEAYVTSALAA
jgi:hypothetical protein